MKNEMPADEIGVDDKPGTDRGMIQSATGESPARFTAVFGKKREEVGDSGYISLYYDAKHQ